MKLEPDDPRLTAYVLGQCPPDEAAEISRAIAADPALGIAAREIESIERLLSSTLSDGSLKLSPRQRGAILAAAREVDVAPITQLPVSRRPHLTSWLAPLAAAALIVLGFYFFVPDVGMDENPAQADAKPSEFPISMLPSPGPVDASQTRTGSPAATPTSMESGAHPVLRPRGPVSAAHHPILNLPIQSGRASHGWIHDAILGQGKLPPADAVRTEEILNHFRIRPIGATAIHQGITLTTETIKCPWKPSATLVVVAIRGARESLYDVTTTWHADPEAVWRYRLIGHATAVGATPRPLSRTLNAAEEHVVVLEIEPSSSSRRGFGGIEWTVNGEPAPSLAVSANPGRTPSIDTRFAAFVCTFSEWLREPTQESGITPELIRSMLGEIEADPPFPRRIEFLQIVRKALELAEAK
ncbi:MAG: VWA domain-containing protein [Luteolibacter sp.]